mgnify:FL=1
MNSMKTMPLDLELIRQQFPALALTDKGCPRIYFDNPGGTQVPQQMLDRMNHSLVHANANHGGAFRTSVDSDAILDDAHLGMADLLNAPSADEIVFGSNMTTLTFSVSRAIGRRLQKGDALLLTRMDHDGNIGPWLKLAEDLDLTVRWLEFDPESYEYRMEDLDGLLSSGDVKLAAINYASNCTGTINDVKTITQKVQASGGLVYVDAVQYVPHGPTDVQDLGCDFLVCSPYKFFGPHQGVLWGRLELLNQLEAYKVRPADEVAPGNFETGTQSHEGQAATLGTIDYLAWLGATMGTEFQSDFPRFSGRRLQLHAAMQAMQQYEQELSSRLITGLQRFPGVVVRGLTAPADMDRRVPTVSFTAENQAPQKIAEALALQNIFVWDGHNYAVEAVRTMGLADKGGVVRVGPVHYNTVTEIDQLLNALEAILD